MENMTAKSRYEAVLESLKELSELGVDCQEDRDKLKKKLAEDAKLSIALVGAFSDGKTSVIAGLAGDTLEGMEIAMDEATAGIHIYEPDEAKMPCYMVDTPGLFGTKEMEVSGRLQHFDAITCCSMLLRARTPSRTATRSFCVMLCVISASLTA